jgi:hypothetical protein
MVANCYTCQENNDNGFFSKNNTQESVHVDLSAGGSERTRVRAHASQSARESECTRVRAHEVVTTLPQTVLSLTVLVYTEMPVASTFSCSQEDLVYNCYYYCRIQLGVDCSAALQ